MTCEEIARRSEWNRIMAWLKPPSDRPVTTPQQRAVNHRTFACATQAVLVAYSLDRLARNTRDAIDILEKLRKNKADLASITESLNTRSAIGQFLFELLASFAQLQRRQIVERTSSAMRHYQKNGRRMGRLDRSPYGKMPDPNGPKVKDKESGLLTDRPAAMIDNPEEQAVIERIRLLRSQGNGLRKICQHLEEAGIPCRGKRWHPSTVASIIRR
jgi:site-specific DNA recombinase